MLFTGGSSAGQGILVMGAISAGGNATQVVLVSLEFSRIHQGPDTDPL